MFGGNLKRVIEDASYLAKSINIQNNWYMRLIWLFISANKIVIESFALQYNLLLLVFYC